MWLRPIAALTLGLCPAVLALAMSCDRGATGEDACRDIEAKRCEWIIGCPTIEGVVDEGDVVACRVFYRDQCLFGIANDSVDADPDDAMVQACLDALDQAGACKPQTYLGACEGAPELAEPDPEASACDVIYRPEKLAGCSFLQQVIPPPETTTGGAGGTPGTGGGTGGTGGA